MKHISEDLRKATAAKDYFIRMWITEVHKRGFYSLTPGDAKEIAQIAVGWASKEMDGLEMTVEVADHALHWIVDLTVPSLQDPYRVQEIPLNPIDSEHVSLDDVYTFFKDIVQSCVSELEIQPITPHYLRKIANLIGYMREECEGCYAAFFEGQTLYRKDGFCVEFNALIGSDLDETSVRTVFQIERKIGNIAFLESPSGS